MAAKSERPFQITVFGATGFTGKHVAEDLKKRNIKGITWAVAGRNETKLKRVLEDVGCPDVPIVMADVNDPKSLRDMCSQTQVVISCVGPFQLYGEPLVKACIEAKCNYIDVTGEPYFMELARVHYHQQAVDAGVYIVSACGFDSIPNDVGVLFTEDSFKGDLQYVESFLTTHSPGVKGAQVHSGTWESLIHSFSSYGEVMKLRKKDPAPPEMPKSLRAPSRRLLFYSKEVASWCVPFPGADRSVVARTQRFLYNEEGKRPVNFKPYITMGSLCQALGVILYMGLIGVLSQVTFLRNIIANNPRFFSLGYVSKEGPTREDVSHVTVGTCMC
jgi:hypothetical protein